MMGDESWLPLLEFPSRRIEAGLLRLHLWALGWERALSADRGTERVLPFVLSSMSFRLGTAFHFLARWWQ